MNADGDTAVLLVLTSGVVRRTKERVSDMADEERLLRAAGSHVRGTGLCRSSLVNFTCTSSRA